MDSGVELGCPDFAFLNWRCTGSGKWGSLQNHNTYPFHHYKIMTPTPTRSLESCKIRARRLLLGSHLFHKLTSTKSQPGPPAHIGYFKKSWPKGAQDVSWHNYVPYKIKTPKDPNDLYKITAHTASGPQGTFRQYKKMPLRQHPGTLILQGLLDGGSCSYSFSCSCGSVV